MILVHTVSAAAQTSPAHGNCSVTEPTAHVSGWTSEDGLWDLAPPYDVSTRGCDASAGSGLAGGDPDSVAATTAPFGDAFAGDSNTFCTGMALRDATHCWANAVSRIESGVQLPVGGNNSWNGGYPGINLFDETYYNLMFNQVNPTVDTNPIQHLMIGTNTIDADPNAALSATWLNAAAPEMYDIATWDTSLPDEKFFPTDPEHTSTTGTWDQVFEFVGTEQLEGGTGYSVGDNLTWSNGATAQVDAVNASGAILYYHVTSWPHPFEGPTYTVTGGTGTGAAFLATSVNDTNSVFLSTGSTDSLTYSQIPAPAGCVFLSYQVWPSQNGTQPYGAESGSTFSVYADGNATPLMDSLTGLTVFSSNLLRNESPRNLSRYQGTFFGFKTLKLCGLSKTGNHSLAIKKVTAGYEAIKVLIAPRLQVHVGIGAPNLNVIGILPVYPQFSNQYEAAISTYNSLYSAMVQDLRTNFARRVIYTDDSSVDMTHDYLGSQPDTQVITSCGISGGVVKFGASAATAIYTAGEVIWASHLTGCSAANGQPLVVGPAPTSTSWTATAQFPTWPGGRQLAAASVPFGKDSGYNELTMNRWIVNTFPPLHMPQNAQMGLAWLVENADKAFLGSIPKPRRGVPPRRPVASVMNGAKPILNVIPDLSVGDDSLPTVAPPY